MILIKKNKLVLLSAFYEPFMSGAEQMVKEIAERLDNDYEIIIITGRFDKALPKKENREKFSLIRVGIGHKQLDKVIYPILAACQVRRLRPLIAHAIMESYAGGALFLVKYFYPEAKRILTLQSGDLDSEVKQKQLLLRFFWKIIHKSPNHITAISAFLANRAEKLGIPSERITIIPNGVDLSLVPQNIEATENRVVCVARLSWEKGLNYLVSAWPEVLQSVPEARLVLVGEGDKRPEIESLIKDLNLSGSIELLGNLPHLRVLEEIKKSKVFVCPSLAEGLGIVFIEAQACGVPPIGTRVGGIPDVIKDGENGLLIEPKNSQAIATAVIKLLSDQDLRQRLTQNALASVKKFDWIDVVGQVNDLYKKITEEKIKVLIATGIYPPDIGGPATFAFYLSKELVLEGCDVNVLTFSNKDISENQAGVVVSRLNSKRSSLARYLVYWFVLLSSSFKFDIVYAFDITSVGLPAALVKLFRGKKIKLIYRLGGDFQWEKALDKGDFVGTLRQYYEKKKFNFKEKIIYLLTNFALKRADWIIYNANFIKDIYEKNRAVSVSSSVIKNIRISNELIKTDFNKTVADDKVKLVYAGRFSKVKNTPTLIRAINLINKNHPELSEHFVLTLIGDGPEELEIKQLIKELNLEDIILVKPKLAHKDLMKEIKESDVVINISYSEVNPNLAAEALSLDKKVIVTKESELFFVGLKNDLLYYIDPFNLEDIAEKIVEAMTNSGSEINPSQLSGLTWPIEDVAEKHLDIFKKLL